MYATVKSIKASGANPLEYDQEFNEITERLRKLHLKCENLLADQGLEKEEIARILTNFRDYEALDHRDLNVKKIMAAYRDKVLPLHDAWMKLKKTSPYRKVIEVFDSYSIKDQLKKRGYAFQGSKSSWSLTVFSPEQYTAECEFLTFLKVELRK